jgi:hypothetical protein
MSALRFLPPKADTVFMDAGEVLFIASRLVTGAVAAFFAIMLWSRTRDAAWMLMVIGVIAAYVETIYAVLELLGIAGERFSIGSVPAASIILPNLRTGFFIAAFVVMVVRKFGRP